MSKQTNDKYIQFTNRVFKLIELQLSSLSVSYRDIDFTIHTYKEYIINRSLNDICDYIKANGLDILYQNSTFINKRLESNDEVPVIMGNLIDILDEIVNRYSDCIIILPLDIYDKLIINKCDIGHLNNLSNGGTIMNIPVYVSKYSTVGFIIDSNIKPLITGIGDYDISIDSESIVVTIDTGTKLVTDDRIFSFQTR